MFDEAGNYIDEAAGTVRDEAAKIVPAGTVGNAMAWLGQPVTVRRGTIVALAAVIETESGRGVQFLVMAAAVVGLAYLLVRPRRRA